jgi:hypothetical protein
MPFPTFTDPPTLAGTFADPAGRNVLTFAWAAAVPEAGYTLDHYEATLWADADRTIAATGGATQNVNVTSATFAGVPKGAGLLLTVVAVGSAGQRSAPISLLLTSQFAATPAVGATPSGVTLPDPEDDDIQGLIAPVRPIYGSVAGVKQWARMLTFGNASGQVSDIDILYHLMAASDEADDAFSALYVVPLTKYFDGQTFRYPPGLASLIERKAAGMLLYARKASLTEQESGTANGLMSYAERKLAVMAQKTSLLGQTCSQGFLPRVYNPAPRNFTLAGDPAGQVYSPGVGYPDVRQLRPHNLPYVTHSWRYGWGGGLD